MLGICSLSVLESCMRHCLQVPVLMYGSETMLWREKERSRLRAVRMDNLRGLLGIRKMDSPKCMDRGVVWSEEGSR